MGDKNQETQFPLSIVVPVYNREKAIVRCLNSLPLNSDLNIEVIVVDDGSTDETLSEVQRVANGSNINFRIVSQRNEGAASARNHGASLARGRFIAFIDSDDVWFERTPATILQAINMDPEPAFIFLQSCRFDIGSQPNPNRSATPTFEIWPSFIEALDANTSHQFGSGTVVVRMETFVSVQGFDTSFACSEDCDMFLRANDRGDCILIKGPDLLAVEMGRSDGLSGQVSQVVDGMEKMVARHNTGHYPGNQFLNQRLVAATVVHATRVCFAKGYPLAAYRLILKHVGLLVSGDQVPWLWRLFLTPILSMIKPLSFPFRWSH